MVGLRSPRKPPGAAESIPSELVWQGRINELTPGMHLARCDRFTGVFLRVQPQALGVNTQKWYCITMHLYSVVFLVVYYNMAYKPAVKKVEAIKLD